MAPLNRQALMAAVAAFNSDSAADWYCRPNTAPAASSPVCAAKPAVKIVRLAATPSPVATTALPAANSA
ncbi:hypothetical protein [Mycobacterium parmense]|uniref:hypothetical protein n=1 Tax=Mycobacterium parmense TaxID=185642 RepID=UPI00111C75EB|nr:hypothetical protein [Mycobacterium parmense]MCV7349507.1 hypothetical protein [Mycobacterium parmense]